jgi:hypothetical protein
MSGTRALLDVDWRSKKGSGWKISIMEYFELGEAAME